MTTPEHPDTQQPVFPSVGGDAPPPLAQIQQPAPTIAPVGSKGPTLTSSRGGNGRRRWAVAGIATLLVVALVGGAFIVFGARPGTPSLVAHYAPANVAAYAELRYDMPGDQHDQLASFMSHFPGFADTASFDQKIDETLENAMAPLDTGLSWKDDIEPWFGGQIGVFSTSLAPTRGTPESFTLVLSVKDRAQLDSAVAPHTTDMQQDTYKGQVIWSGTAGGSDEVVHFAVTDEAFLLSALNEDLKAALDTKAGERDGLADDSFFLTQLGALHADRLGLFYTDHAALMESMAAGSEASIGCMTGLEAARNVKLLGEVRAEPDHLDFNVRSQYPSGESLPVPPANRSTSLAESMPGSTAAYVEFRDAGAVTKFLVTQLMSCLEASPDNDGGFGDGGFDLSQLELMLGVAPEDYFNFVQDAGVGITAADGKFGAGLVATVDDENVARTRVDRLLSALRMAGGLGGDDGSGPTVTEQQHGDVTITVITLPSSSDVLGQPSPVNPMSIGVAVANGRLYMGLGDFVATALDQSAADSLASAPRLRSALAEAGADNSGIVYVDIAALRGFMEANMPAEDAEHFNTEVQPYLEPLDTFVNVSRNDNGINASHGFLYVE